MKRLISVLATADTSMEYREILYEINDRILTNTPNRPDKINAFTVRIFNELVDAFDQADAADSVRGLALRL
ncbi:hypothetical protein [Desulfatibacillum alkenivorans]|jgi:enoyl-CoA hydratase/carnithine racemase|nr:hypothetical protein [Desulfatibacillum alkenivorans]